MANCFFIDIRIANITNNRLLYQPKLQAISAKSIYTWLWQIKYINIDSQLISYI